MTTRWLYREKKKAIVPDAEIAEQRRRAVEAYRWLVENGTEEQYRAYLNEWGVEEGTTEYQMAWDAWNAERGARR